MLSIILPAYNEEQMIPITVRTLAETMGTEIPYELVFVDDGSRDKTWDVICAQAQENPHILGVHFSRNFGKEAAMFAGLAKATGDCCVVMDCDLQHPPEKVVEMYHLWQQGYEVVEGVKEDRGRESAAHRFAAKSFYKLISDAAGMDMSHSSDFKLLDRKVVDTLNALPERNVFFRALSYWVGYRKATVSYCVAGADGRRIQVVDAAADPLRADQHRRFFHRAHADRHLPRRADAAGLHCLWLHFPVSENRRHRAQRLYDRHSPAAVFQQYSDDQPRHHRVLHLPDLCGVPRASALHHLADLRHKAGARADAVSGFPIR